MASEDQCCDLALFVDGSPPADHHKRYRAVSLSFLKDLTVLLPRAIGQRVVACFTGPFPTAAAQVLVRDYCVGSLLLNASNFPDVTRASQLVPQLAGLSEQGHPLWVGFEQGIGVVSQFPKSLTLSAGHSQPIISAVGSAIGKELASIGVQWVLAPNVEAITDLTEPLDTASRFSDNPEKVSQYAQAFLEGLSTTGVATCAEASLSATIQEIYRSIDEGDLDIEGLLQRGDIQPIIRLLQTQLLESLLLTSALSEYDDSDIAQRSFQTLVQRILRDRLRYQGLLTVASESPLEADANSCAKHAPLRTLLFGSDLVLLPTDPEIQRDSLRAIYAAVGTSVLPASALQRAAERISLFRSRQSTRSTGPGGSIGIDNLAQQHRNLIRESYRASTTAISSGSSPLLNLPATSILLLLTPSVPSLPSSNNTANADPFEPLGRAIARFHNRTRHVPYTLSTGVTSTHAAFLDRATAIVLVLCNTSSAFVDSQMEFVGAVQNCLRSRESRPGEQRPRKIALAAGDPRDLRKPLEGWWEVCCYEYTSGALEAATEVIMGHRTATGTLPLRLGRNLNGQ